MHPTELTCPCCLPALGEFSEMPPHGGLPQSLGEGYSATQAGPDFSTLKTAGSLLRGGFA
jgi:hypothetical protein